MFGSSTTGSRPSIRGLFFGRSVASRVDDDFQALIARMRSRLFPETMPVLVSFWLKSLAVGGYRLREWRALNTLLERALRVPPPDEAWRRLLADANAWIHEAIILPGKAPDFPPLSPEPFPADVDLHWLSAYIVRLLNEWLPIEVARLLVSRSEFMVLPEEGIPAWAVGRAIERLLVRGHLSRPALEMVIESQLFSPESVYPADLEILRDVILSLLGQTRAPVPSVLPARLLCVAGDSRLPADYREALRHARLISRTSSEEIHVPLSRERAFDTLADETVHIGSIVVTLDGRTWESQSLQGGEYDCVVYRPIGSLRIDYSGEHATLRAPWPEARLCWSGVVRTHATLQIFGREWRSSRWVVDERTWLDLIFSRVLPAAEIGEDPSQSPCRLRPAFVDMGWAALEKAVTTAIAQKNLEPVEQLRHFELIPIGCAIVGLAEEKVNRRSPNVEVLETHLKALRFLEASILSTYGRVPWKILPLSIRAAFLRGPLHPVLRRLLKEVFEGLPDAIARADQAVPIDRASRSTSPHAA